MRIFESLLEESNKKKFIKKWLGDDTEKIEEYDKAYEEYRQVFDNEIKKRSLNWQTSMTLEIFEEILNDVNDRKSKAKLKKQNKDSGKSDFLSYVLANPDCDLTYLGTLNKWDYFKINTWPGAILADSPKASLNGDTGAQWCIGWRDPDKQKFDEYTRKGLDFVLIVKSDSLNKDGEEKYCIQIRRKTGIVEAIWDPVDDPIEDKRTMYKILYGQNAKTISKRIPGILKGIDIRIEGHIQPENKIVDIGEEDILQSFEKGTSHTDFKLYESGTDLLINGNDITTLEFVELKPIPKNFFDLLGLINVEKVILPKGLRIIREKYFSGIKSLKYIEIPESVTEIGQEAFSYCERLETIKLPANLKKIEDNCFRFCDNLAHVEIPDSVEVIGEKAFNGCYNLKFVKLPPNLKKISYGAFSSSGLERIELPDSVEEIGRFAFTWSSLVSIKLPPNLKKIEGLCFEFCLALKYVEIPESVTEICEKAFNECVELESIKLPASLRKIGWYAFSHCKNLKHIEIPDSVEEIEDHAFYGCDITDQNLIDKIEGINKDAFLTD